jgi:cellulose synthase/poly-beta-1,6-N-acetylglucosamine synthase-like glycosyltransferase
MAFAGRTMVERCFSLQALCERHENFYSRIIEAAGGKRNLLRLTLSKIRPEMSSPIVSVVMSVLNGERFLREAVESILDQSLREFEFIIINDGSTDFSGSILDSYQHKDPRLRVVHQSGSGIEEIRRSLRSLLRIVRSIRIPQYVIARATGLNICKLTATATK